MPEKNEKKVYVGVRLNPVLVTRLDALATGFAGLAVPRSEVIRLAIERGLDALEKERSKTSKRGAK